MGQEFKLLTTQKNDVFRILEQTELNHPDFRWFDDYEKKGIVKLWHKPSQYFVTFSYWEREECYFITCSPGEKVTEQSSQINTWDAVLNVVDIWAFCLKREIDAPDLWSQMEKYTAYISLPPTEELPPDEPISAVDAGMIEDRLWIFAERVEKEFKLVGDDLKLLRHQNAVLIDIAKRSSKKAFLYAALGVIATIAMGIGLTPENAKTLWQLLRESLSPFLFLQ